jgi:rubrerythrin
MPEDLTLKQSVELAITTEQVGREFYQKMAKKFGDSADVSAVFAQLAKDEEVHEEQFKKLLEHLPAEAEEAKNEELYQFLRATAISEFFQKDYFKNADSIGSTAEALGTALSLEKSTLQYYQAIRAVLGENKQLDAIINAEKNHVLALVRIIPTDAKFRGLGDKF